MKFFGFSLVAISSLFAATYAAPTAQESSLVHVPELNLKEPVRDALKARTDDVLCSKMRTCIVEIKKHTAKINSTCSSVHGPVFGDAKAELIEAVKDEVTIICGLISSLTGEVFGLVGGVIGEIQRDELIGLVLELILEIVCTLKNVLLILKCTIFELLGSLVFVLLCLIVQLVCCLNLLVDGILKIVCGLLVEIVGLLAGVLSGLLPIIFGIAGGLLGKIGGLVGGVLSCLF